jgi:short-subunit dehydrogenase
VAGIGLDGRRALVTGAAGGLGTAIARALHARGATVLLSGRDAERLERLRGELGERAEVVPADLAERDQVGAAGARAAGADVLVANAALPASGPIDDYTAEQVHRAIDVNLAAPLQLARALVPGMVERGAGHVVLVSSVSGKVATAGSALYSATKYGLRGFGSALREDVRGTGVGVTVVFPGFIREAGMFADSGVELPPYARTRSPEDVARAVVRGVERGRAEVDVAPLPIRASALAYALAPRLVAAFGRAAGANAVAAQLAERQRGKR